MQKYVQNKQTTVPWLNYNYYITFDIPQSIRTHDLYLQKPQSLL